MAAPPDNEPTQMDLDDTNDTNEKKMCMICCDDKTEFPNLECGHNDCCLDCLSEHFAIQVRKENLLAINVCLEPNCEYNIPDDQIRAILRDKELIDQFDKLQQVLKETNVRPLDDSDTEMDDVPPPPFEDEGNDEKTVVDYKAQGLNPPPDLTPQARKIMRARKNETAGDRHFQQWNTLKNVSQRKLRGYHFDWWMFPWCEDAMTRPGFWVRRDDIITLVHDTDFQERFLFGLRTLIKLKREKEIDIVMSNNDWWIHPSRKSKVYVSMDIFLFISYGVLEGLHRKNDDRDRLLIENILKFRASLIEIFHELVPLFGMDEMVDELDDWCEKNQFLCFTDIRDYRKFREITKRDRKEYRESDVGKMVRKIPYRTRLDAVVVENQSGDGDDEKEVGGTQEVVDAPDNAENPPHENNQENGETGQEIQHSNGKVPDVE